MRRKFRIPGTPTAATPSEPPLWGTQRGLRRSGPQKELSRSGAELPLDNPACACVITQPGQAVFGGCLGCAWPDVVLTTFVVGSGGNATGQHSSALPSEGGVVKGSTALHYILEGKTVREALVCIPLRDWHGRRAQGQHWDSRKAPRTKSGPVSRYPCSLDVRGEGRGMTKRQALPFSQSTSQGQHWDSRRAPRKRAGSFPWRPPATPCQCRPPGRSGYDRTLRRTRAQPQATQAACCAPSEKRNGVHPLGSNSDVSGAAWCTLESTRRTHQWHPWPPQWCTRGWPAPHLGRDHPSQERPCPPRRAPTPAASLAPRPLFSSRGAAQSMILRPRLVACLVVRPVTRCVTLFLAECPALCLVASLV